MNDRISSGSGRSPIWGAPRASMRQPSSALRATSAPIHAILWRGCLGKPVPRAARTSSSGAPTISSILAPAARSGMVSKSQTMTCSETISATLRAQLIQTGLSLVKLRLLEREANWDLQTRPVLDPGSLAGADSDSLRDLFSQCASVNVRSETAAGMASLPLLLSLHQKNVCGWVEADDHLNIRSPGARTLSGTVELNRSQPSERHEC